MVDCAAWWTAARVDCGSDWLKLCQVPAMQRQQPPPTAFQAPVDVHASADGQVYLFRRRQLESAASSEDEELDVTEPDAMELRPRAPPETNATEGVQLLERDLKDGDNLNKLALQYGCKVADIKRANNLIQEQDLFALKSIKIPVKKHSFLTETFDTDLNDDDDDNSASASASASARPNGPPPYQEGSGDRPKPSLREVTDFLKEMDQDIEKLIQSTGARDQLLFPPPSETRPRGSGSGPGGRRLRGHGADWGIQWWNAMVAMLLIGVILPIFYVVYFKTKDAGEASPASGGGAGGVGDGPDVSNSSANS